jgi:ubiquinone/menaquinone biosynthesis C-methylase UbiE
MGVGEILSQAIQQRVGSLNAIRHIEFGLLRSWLMPGPGDTTCDVGCGGGFFTHALSLRSHRCVGLDIATEALDRAILSHKVGNCVFVCGDAEKLPFRDASFSRILALSTLEHFTRPDIALKEVNRVLESGGLLALSCDALTYHGISPVQKKRYMEQHSVVFTFTARSLQGLVESAGFEVLTLRYLISSPGASLVYKLGAKLRWGQLFTLGFPLLYPVAYFSDRLSARQDQGYFLALAARKCRKV